MKRIMILIAATTLFMMAGCNGSTTAETTQETVQTETSSIGEPVKEVVKNGVKTNSLADILDAQADANKERFQYRNPRKTIEFFGIKPGMTVAEVLPGGGWYSKILIPYLGDEGHLVGIDYSIPMWGEFGGFANAEFLEKKKTWAADWVAQAEDWKNGNETKLSAFAFGNAPKSLKDKVDVIFLPRAFHHLNRFEQAHLAGALDDMKTILKPDGVVAIVAHRAAEDQDDGWANGDNGYMKQSTVVALMEEAGFELSGQSEINANPKDQAKSENGDMVWRLPPSLATSRDDPELRAKMVAIGETDRMTLKFSLKK